MARQGPKKRMMRAILLTIATCNFVSQAASFTEPDAATLPNSTTTSTTSASPQEGPTMAGQAHTTTGPNKHDLEGDNLLSTTFNSLMDETPDESAHAITTSSSFDNLLGLRSSTENDLGKGSPASSSGGADLDLASFYPEPTDVPATPDELDALDVERESDRPGSARMDQIGSDPSSEENWLLVKNRKSREQKNQTELLVNRGANSSEPDALRIVNRSDDDRSFTTTESPVQVHKGQAAPMINGFDYDDFDLDYQLKLNGSLSGSGGLSKPPSWSSLITQPHVFTASPSQPANASIVYNTAPPMMPALLTVKSTELTSQELNKIRPQLLMYQDNLDGSSAGSGSNADQVQSLANGDLLATASYSGPPSQSNLVESTHTTETNNSSSQQSDAFVISLVNGSPVIRQQQRQQQVNLSRPEEQSSTVSTIVVNSSPSIANEFKSTVAPSLTSSTTPSASTSASSMSNQAETSASNSTIGSRSTSSRETSAGSGATSTSQANQWFNYPHPNLHHNPLLLHHILNNPTMYAQHVANQLQPAPLLSSPVAKLQSASSPSPANQQAQTTTTVFPTTQVSTVTQPSNIIEKSTLSSFVSNQPAPINRTQLQMQLNEMRALAAAATSTAHFDQNQLINLNRSQPVHHHHVVNMNSQPSWLATANSNRPVNPGGWTGRPQEVDNHPSLMGSMFPARGRFNPQPNMVGPHLQAGQDVRLRPGPVRLPAIDQSLMPRPPLAPVGLMHHLLGVPGPFGTQPSTLNGNRPFQSMTSLPPPPQMRPMPVNQNPPARPEQQNQFRAPVGTSASSMMAAPSHLQEVYAARPFPSSSTNSEAPPISTPSSFAGSQSAQKESIESLIKQLNQAADRQQPSRGASTPASMSEEEMSTYVAQLAALNSPLQQVGAASPPKSIGGPYLTNPDGSEVDPALQKLLADLDRSVNEQPQFNNSQLTVESLLKQAKIIGLPEEVQAQIYKDHLQPLLGSTATKQWNQQPANQMMDSSRSTLVKTMNDHDPHQSYELSAWQRPAQASQSQQSSKETYYSIDGHQEQQKREREHMMIQREKQIAFIEALRASIGRLHNMDLSAIRARPQTGIADSEADKANLTASASSADLILPDQFDDHQLPAHPSAIRPRPHIHPQPGSSSYPEWLERQVLQESLVHESARVNPFGQTTKTTYIGAPARLHASHPPLGYVPRPILRLHPSASVPASSLAMLQHHYPPPQPPMHSPFARPPVWAGPLSSLVSAESSLHPASAPLNPTKLLADRFPLASAPAYLVKLPTLTGGTITAAGSLVPPFSHLWRNRPMGRLLNPNPEQGVKLVSTVAVRPAPSIAHPLFHSPPPAFYPQGAAPPPAYLQSLPPPPLLHHQPAHLDMHLHQLAEQQRGLQALSSSPNVSSLVEPSGDQARQPDNNGHPVQSGVHMPVNPGSPYPNSASSALSRLQQATASLVELTSLASLVEEMVSGSDLDSSPAMALANAINSLTAVQTGIKSNQMDSNYNSNNNTSSGDYHGSNNVQLNNQPFSWKNLFNPNIWRDKTALGAKTATLERLVANAAIRPRPPARLKVKYIRVPVAVYETSNGAQIGEIAILPGRNSLLSKTQLAELAANGNSDLSSALSASVPLQPTTTLNTPTSSSNNAANQHLSVSQPTSTSASNLAQSATSSDLLFDELAADSATPQLALTALRGIQLVNPDSSEYLPVFGLRPPKGLSGAIQHKPMESALYYTMLASPSTTSSSAVASLDKLVDSGSTSQVKKTKKGKKHKAKDDEDDESSEDDDDDDLLSSGDMPILESIISTLITGSPHMPHPSSAMSAPFPYHGHHADYHMSPSRPYSTPNWRSRPFGGLKSEASNTVETYASPSATHYLSPIGKYGHRLSFTEMVGALGAKKLISNIWNKRKTARTHKRDVQSQPYQPKKTATQPASLLSSAKRPRSVISSSSDDKSNGKSSRDNFIKFPPIVAYDELSVRSSPSAGSQTKSHRYRNSPTSSPKQATSTSKLSLTDSKQLSSASSSTDKYTKPVDHPDEDKLKKGAEKEKAFVDRSSHDTHQHPGKDHDRVQYNFYLNNAHNQARIRAPSVGKFEGGKLGGHRSSSSSGKGRTAMPLYHVVD